MALFDVSVYVMRYVILVTIYIYMNGLESQGVEIPMPMWRTADCFSEARSSRVQIDS